MHLSKTLPVASALLLSALPLAAADFDREDIPTACTTICEPIRQLVRLCDVDDDAVGGDRNEDLLERQCVCQNASFDVANVAGQCQDCVEKNWRNGCRDNDDDDSDDDDDDDCDDGREDINKIVRVCGFTSVTFDTAAASQVQTISVSASKATNTAQLTTTVNPQETGSISIDESKGDSSNNNDNNNQGSGNNQDGDDGNGAAQGALPGMIVCISGAVLAGIMML